MAANGWAQRAFMCLNGSHWPPSGWVQRAWAIVAATSAMGRIDTPVRRDGPERMTTMFRKIAVALIATSMLVAPALAAKTSKNTPAPMVTTAAAPKAETKGPATVKAAVPVKVVKKHRVIRHRVYAAKHRHHVRHVAAKSKSTQHVKTVTSKANGVHVVKTKKLRTKKQAAAVMKSAPLS